MTKPSRELATSQRKAATLRRRAEWEPIFLDALAKCGVITYAAQIVGVDRSTVYRHRDANPEFAAAWDDAIETSTDLIEREVFRRAVEGVTEPVVSAGKHVVDVQRYSDRLAEFLLRARRPEIYRERAELHHSGSIGLSVVALAEKAREGRRELSAGDGDD